MYKYSKVPNKRVASILGSFSLQHDLIGSTLKHQHVYYYYYLLLRFLPSYNLVWAYRLFGTRLSSHLSYKGQYFSEPFVFELTEFHFAFL